MMKLRLLAFAALFAALLIDLKRPLAAGDKVPLTLRIDTAIEVDYLKHGGILPYVLRQILAEAA